MPLATSIGSPDHANLRRLAAAKPNTPCPLVQPLPMRTPTPTSSPAITSRPGTATAVAVGSGRTSRHGVGAISKPAMKAMRTPWPANDPRVAA